MNVTRQSLKSEPPIRIGQTIDGKYFVEQFLGEDDHSVLAVARHRILGEKEVAIKVLRPEIALGDPAVSQRFQNQISGAAGVKSESMTAVIDYGLLPNHGAYAVMERLHGYHLGRVITAGGTFHEGEAIQHIMAAARVLYELHIRNHAHGSIRPACLFRALRENGPPITKVIGIVDTLRPPHASAGGDIQALGTTFETMCRHTPSPEMAKILTRCRTGGFRDALELFRALVALSTQITA